MPRPMRHDVKEEYAYWCATTKRLRVTLGLPQNDLQFAKAKEVDPRTLRRWKAEEAFIERVKEHKKELANNRPNSTISKGDLVPVTEADDPVFDPDLSVDEQHYLQVKDTLIRMAQEGNQGAIDLYLKHYGKSFVENEQQGFDDYREMSDDRLVDETLSFIGVDRVSAWLARAVS
jgi:hypothetical protein